MARKKYKTKKDSLNKSFESNKKSPFVKKGVIGSNAIHAINTWAMSLKSYELRYPANMKTFHDMYTKDESVGGVLNATYTFVENAFQDWRFVPNKSSPESVRIAEFLTYCVTNMKGTVREFARNAASFNQFGFSIIEKDYKKFKPELYKGELPSGMDKDKGWMIDKLRFIPQRSLYASEPFIIKNGGRDLVAVQQDTCWFTNSNGLPEVTVTTPNYLAQPNLGSSSYTNSVIIPRNKFMLLGINVTDSNPMGTSPLEQIWVCWKEKVFYEDYLSIGVSKDMAGMPLLRIPVEVLNKANADSSSPEGKFVLEMSKQISALHAGEQNMVILGSDTQANGSTFDYDLQFLGITGQGKQFDLQTIINAKRSAIYSSFGALNLISNEGSGGYNQLEGQNNIHYAFVKNTIATIEEAIQNDLVPQLLKMNGIEYSIEDLPRFKAGDITGISLDESGKFIQRVASVGLLPKVPSVINEILRKGGFDFQVDDDLTVEELDLLTTSDTSRAGEGLGTSGTGNTQLVGSGDNNLENS